MIIYTDASDQGFPADEQNVLLDAFTLKPINCPEGAPPISIATAVGPIKTEGYPR